LGLKVVPLNLPKEIPKDTG